MEKKLEIPGFAFGILCPTISVLCFRMPDRGGSIFALGIAAVGGAVLSSVLRRAGLHMRGFGAGFALAGSFWLSMCILWDLDTAAFIGPVWRVCLACAMVGVLSGVVLHLKEGKLTQSVVLALSAIFILSSTALWVNVMADDTPIKAETAVITKAEERLWPARRSRTTYYWTVASSALSSPIKVRVSDEEYRAEEAGNHVKIQLYKGIFGVPWAKVGDKKI